MAAMRSASGGRTAPMSTTFGLQLGDELDWTSPIAEDLLEARDMYPKYGLRTQCRSSVAPR
eukprot:15234497-Alexandrium_andersonii.AAC.1